MVPSWTRCWQSTIQQLGNLSGCCDGTALNFPIKLNEKLNKCMYSQFAEKTLQDTMLYLMFPKMSIFLWRWVDTTSFKQFAGWCWKKCYGIMRYHELQTNNAANMIQLLAVVAGWTSADAFGCGPGEMFVVRTSGLAQTSPAYNYWPDRFLLFCSTQ